MKISNMLHKIIYISIIFLGLVHTSYAAIPAIFFSDLTNGSVCGWEGSQTKGAAITIWGVNLGPSRGSSYITVGGRNLTTDSDYAEWGAMTNPATARGLQRITFWLNSSMSLGSTNISVTTSDGTSQPIPFYTKSTGNIYFVSPNGNDSHNGKSVANAWRNPSKARGTLQAGDVAYFKSGIYKNIDNWGSVIDFWVDNHNNGSVNNGISLVSFPGEVAQLGDNSTQYVLDHHGSGGDVLSYWTFSKFIMRSNMNVTNWGMDGPGSDDHNRFVGNDISTTAGGKTILEFSGQQGGQTYLYILGNMIGDAGVDTRGQLASTKGYSIYMAGYGAHDYIFIAWNELAYNTMGRGIQVYAHTVHDSIDHLYIYGNSIHDNAFNGAVLGGGDGGGGSYNYQYVKRLYFYNNIVFNNGMDNTNSKWAGIHLGGVGWGNTSGDYYIYNNTFHNNTAGAYYFSGSANSVTMKNNIIYNGTKFFENAGFDNGTIPVVEKNLYYGGANDIPSWEHNYISTNPMFVNAPSNNFSLQDESPIKDIGVTISLFDKDFNGVMRTNNAYSIGACENYTSTTSPPVSISIQSVTIQ